MTEMEHKKAIQYTDLGAKVIEENNNVSLIWSITKGEYQKRTLSQPKGKVKLLQSN